MQLLGDVGGERPRSPHSSGPGSAQCHLCPILRTEGKFGRHVCFLSDSFHICLIPHIIPLLVNPQFLLDRYHSHHRISNLVVEVGVNQVSHGSYDQTISLFFGRLCAAYPQYRSKPDVANPGISQTMPLTPLTQILRLGGIAKPTPLKKYRFGYLKHWILKTILLHWIWPNCWFAPNILGSVSKIRSFIIGLKSFIVVIYIIYQYVITRKTYWLFIGSLVSQLLGKL